MDRKKNGDIFVTSKFLVLRWVEEKEVGKDSYNTVSSLWDESKSQKGLVTLNKGHIAQLEVPRHV